VRFFALIVALALISLSNSVARADEFRTVTLPRFTQIEPRLVYGLISYDFNFVGKDNKTRNQSASAYLKSLIQSKFNNRTGNYIVTLEIMVGDQKVASEPIMSANWETNKFLFVTTSEKSNLVVNRNGVLVDNLVVDGNTNRVGLSMKIRYSESMSVDMSLLTELSELSKTASLAGLSPGVKIISDAYMPFSSVLARLLSRYTDVDIVDNTVGAFTLLDNDFGNQLRYSGSNFNVNIYLKTTNSQLPTNFSNKTFNIVNFSLPLTEVKSGAGAARAPVIDLIASDSDDLGAFVKAIMSGASYGSTNPVDQTEIRDSCARLKKKLNKFVTSRDAALLYWAFLRSFHRELIKYKDGKECAGTDLTEDLTALNLTLTGSDWQ
jgi:hypothetical protein